MKRFASVIPGAAVCALCLLAGQATAAAAEPWPSIVSGETPAAQKIRAALDDQTRMEFIETPLREVVEFLESQHDIPIKLDQRAFDKISMPVDAPITQDLRGISLRSALRHMLRDLDLDYAVADEMLVITTPDGAAAQAEIRIYNVSPLIGDDPDASSLAAALATVLPPATLQMPGYPAGVMGGMGYGGAASGGGMGGMGGMGGGGMFSVPELQHGSGLAAESSEGQDFPGGPAMGHGMGSVCPGGGLGGESGPASAALQITPLKNLLIVRGTEQGHRRLSELLGALAVAIKDRAVVLPPS